MAITLMKYKNIEYHRITKAWNGFEHQRYVRVGKDFDKSFKEAMKIEEALSERQRAFQLMIKLNGSIYFHGDHRIVGIIRRPVSRRSSGVTDSFVLRHNPGSGGKIKYSQVSIDFHGFDKAFDLAVNKMCDWIGLDEKSAVKQAMKDAKVHYCNNSDVQTETIDDEMLRIEATLKNDTKYFSDNYGAISGR